jgi:hypothetical protein
MAEKLAAAFKVNLRDVGAVADVILSPVTLYSISIVNNQAAIIFVQLFDTVGAVTIGTTVPDWEFSVAASTSAVINLNATGLFFKTGLRAASTTTEKGATPSAAGVHLFFGVN